MVKFILKNSLTFFLIVAFSFYILFTPSITIGQSVEEKNSTQEENQDEFADIYKTDWTPYIIILVVVATVSLIYIAIITSDGTGETGSDIKANPTDTEGGKAEDAKPDSTSNEPLFIK